MTKKDSATDLKNGIILFTVGAIHEFSKFYGMF